MLFIRYVKQCLYSTIYCVNIYRARNGLPVVISYCYTYLKLAFLQLKVSWHGCVYELHVDLNNVLTFVSFSFTFKELLWRIWRRDTLKSVNQRLKKRNKLLIKIDAKNIITKYKKPWRHTKRIRRNIFKWTFHNTFMKVKEENNNVTHGSYQKYVAISLS